MRTIPTRIFFVMLILVLVFPLSFSAAAEWRTALVIGNGQYDVGQLKNPVNDATDMASTLQDRGFTVILKKNARQQEMEEAIRGFGRQLKRGGVGLFFYAGHGIQINGRNYLVPIGARIEKETDAKYQAIDAEMVLDEMGNAGNPMNIVILDACRDNPIGRSLRSAGRGLAIISDAPQGTFITYSTSPGKTAADGDGRNSPYTAALLKSISEPGLPIEQVFKKVRQRLSRETGNRQMPWELSSLQGDFYFTPGRANRVVADLEDREAAPVARPERPVGRESYDVAMGARPAAATNVAPKAKITASASNASGTTPYNLVDGNLGELGSQIYGNYSGWWEFDLGQPYTINKAHYQGFWKHPSPEYSKVDYRFSEYAIKAKLTKDAPWITVVHISNNTNVSNDHVFKPVTAQYWLFEVIRSNYVHPYWTEFELYTSE